MTSVSSMKLPKDPHHSDSSYTMKILWPHSLGWKSPDVRVLGLNVATLGTAANPVNTLSQGFQQSSVWINPFYRFGSRHLETLNTMRLHFCCMLSIAQQLDEGYRICILGVVLFLLSLTSVCWTLRILLITAVGGWFGGGPAHLDLVHLAKTWQISLASVTPQLGPIAHSSEVWGRLGLHRQTERGLHSHCCSCCSCCLCSCSCCSSQNVGIEQGLSKSPSLSISPQCSLDVDGCVFTDWLTLMFIPPQGCSLIWLRYVIHHPNRALKKTLYEFVVIK